jgi:hypothetical protein
VQRVSRSSRMHRCDAAGEPLESNRVAASGRTARVEPFCCSGSAARVQQAGENRGSGATGADEPLRSGSAADPSNPPTPPRPISPRRPPYARTVWFVPPCGGAPADAAARAMCTHHMYCLAPASAARALPSEAVAVTRRRGAADELLLPRLFWALDQTLEQVAIGPGAFLLGFDAFEHVVEFLL